MVGIGATDPEIAGFEQQLPAALGQATAGEGLQQQIVILAVQVAAAIENVKECADARRG